MEEVNEKLYDLSGTEVSLRQIREDIKFMRDSAGYNVPIEAYPLEGRKCYYRYADRNFTIFNNELSTEEVRSAPIGYNQISELRMWFHNQIPN